MQKKPSIKEITRPGSLAIINRPSFLREKGITSGFLVLFS